MRSLLLRVYGHTHALGASAPPRADVEFVKYEHPLEMEVSGTHNANLSEECEEYSDAPPYACDTRQRAIPFLRRHLARRGWQRRTISDATTRGARRGPAMCRDARDRE
jgi:hypothetical protein